MERGEYANYQQNSCRLEVFLLSLFRPKEDLYYILNIKPTYDFTLYTLSKKHSLYSETILIGTDA